MSVKYRPVQWTRSKIVYDLLLVAGVAIYIQVFSAAATSALTGAEALSGATVRMRAWGSCALLMLTAILCIGPLARLDKRFLPLLYNRRHFGVLMFFVGLVHAREVLSWYHGYSDVPPLVSLLTYDAAITDASLPFQLFGAGALLILFVMAATSHDIWQKTLGAALWKSLHMAVYLAFALVVLHVAYGVLQYETHPGLAALVVGATALVSGLHLAAARRSTALDNEAGLPVDGWLDAGPAAALPDGRARALATPAGERIAVVRHGEKVSAVHGVCAHQGGPLYEGAVLDDCLTCPWHGWTYRPADGCSPPPFKERIPTYRVKLVDGRVWVDPEPLAPGTPVEPATIGGSGG